MSSIAATTEPLLDVRGVRVPWPFVASLLGVAGLACALAGWAPLGFSIVTVFLFAGPHNWMEARYFIERMPPRWGRLRWFFLTGLTGVALLTVAFAAMPWLARATDWDVDRWLIATAVWNTALVLWVLALAWMRSRQNPRRAWAWLLPLGLLLVALAWAWPRQWSLGLVYLHPLIALWFFDRELKRCRPEWRPAYHGCLTVVAILLAGLWWRLADAPPLPGTDALTIRITEHAGAGIFQQAPVHLLVATHTFLEMLHYGVWLLAMPLVAMKSAPWRLDLAPLTRKSGPWRLTVLSILAIGGLMVLVLWGGFIANYPLTRDIYFTVAMIHVLAEVPFLLRAL